MMSAQLKDGIGFDVETADADELYKQEPVSAGETGFIRLCGVVRGQDARIVTVDQLLKVVDAAPSLYGHNILGFDGPALTWHHGVDWEKFSARAVDSELIARQAFPPRSRDTGTSADKYDMDHVAERLGLEGKTDKLTRLKAQFGGYDAIPVDNTEYRDYLMGDLRATEAIAREMADRFPDDPYVEREHKVAAIAGRMTLNGFRVDPELLEQRVREGNERKQKALGALHDHWGLPVSKTISRGRGKAKHFLDVDVDSPLASDSGRAWLGEMYSQYGVPNPPKTGKTQKLATGAEDLKVVASDPRCPKALQQMIALMAVVTTTRTVYQTASDCLCPDGRVHPRNSFRQASGRWSVTKPGLTVFGKRGGRHRERDIFLPDEGHVLLSFDLSQVDMRSLCGLSGDLAYRELFMPGRDAHSEIAGRVFGAAPLDSKGHHPRRHDAKAVGHGWGYGLGPRRMIERDGMDPEVVYTFINGMKAQFPRLIQWREEIRAIGKAGEILDNGFGRRMRCDTQRAYTTAPALMGQGGARDILCESLLKLSPDWYPYLRVMVHDEIVVSCPEESVDECIHDFTAAMTWDYKGVPILCDMSGPGKNWGEISAK